MLTKIIIENNPYMFVKELEKAIKAGYDVVYEDGREPTINGWTLSAMLIKDEVVENGIEIIKPKQVGRPTKGAN
jgi:hypothetical protein